MKGPPQPWGGRKERRGGGTGGFFQSRTSPRHRQKKLFQDEINRDFREGNRNAVADPREKSVFKKKEKAREEGKPFGVARPR